VQSPSSGSALFELAKVTVVKIPNKNTSVCGDVCSELFYLSFVIKSSTPGMAHLKMLFKTQNKMHVFYEFVGSRKLKKKIKKAVPLQAWCGPEGSRKLRFPDYMTTAQDDGKVASLTHRPPLPPGNAPGTHLSEAEPTSGP
jgi:hypothetical protein